MGWILFALLWACGSALDASHMAKDVLSLEAKIPLAGVSGRIDHMVYDSAGHRLFVAALGNNTVEVVDLSARARVHSITGLNEPQGLMFIPGLGRLVVANGSDGNVIFYEGTGFKEQGRVALGDDADNVRFDGRQVYVGYGSGGIAVIDPSAMKKVADLPLEGHPESFQLGDSGRVFINVPDLGSVVMGDLGQLKVLQTWENNGVSANFPMSIDRNGRRLFIGYRHSTMVRVLDSRTGAVLASMPCVGDTDDLFFDETTGLLFVSGGEGFIDVFRGNVLINHIATRRGARTSLWLPSEKKLIVALPARGGEEAALWIYRM